MQKEIWPISAEFLTRDQIRWNRAPAGWVFGIKVQFLTKMYGLFWIWVNVGKHPCFTDISISFPYSLRQGLILFLALEVCKQTHISNGSRFRWNASVRAFVEANQVKKCKAIESVIIAEAENSPFSTYLKQKYEVRCVLDIKTEDIGFIESISIVKTWYLFPSLTCLRSAWQALWSWWSTSRRIHCGFPCTWRQEWEKLLLEYFWDIRFNCLGLQVQITFVLVGSLPSYSYEMISDILSFFVVENDTVKYPV